MVEAAIKQDYGRDSGDITPSNDAPLPTASTALLSRFTYHLTEARNFLRTVDPYAPNPLAPLNQKIERFLGKYAGMSYGELLRQAHAERFTEEDYVLLPKNGLRRKLFDHRASVYLAALDSCEQEGFAVRELVEAVRKAKFPPIKKGELEPTLEKIIEFLQK